MSASPSPQKKPIQLNKSFKFKDKKHESKDNYICGYLILFDIIDSTKRKEKYKKDDEWLEHLNLFYSEFYQFSNQLIKKITEEVKKITFLDDKAVIKTIGDMGFLFLPFEKQKTPNYDEEKKEGIPNISKLILEKTMNFCNYKSGIPELKLKTIITYLYQVFLINLNKGENKFDIVGKGIDFSFRLEGFANSSCIILNKYLVESIKKLGECATNKTNEDLSINFSNTLYDIVKVRKTIRGWDDEKEEFYFLTNPEMTKDTYEKREDFLDENSIYAELFLKHEKRP